MISGRAGWLGRDLEQTFAPQERREIFARARKILVQCQRRLVHYWPVRWR
jgi:hypothetical protein